VDRLFYIFIIETKNSTSTFGPNLNDLITCITVEVLAFMIICLIVAKNNAIWFQIMASYFQFFMMILNLLTNATNFHVDF